MRLALALTVLALTAWGAAAQDLLAEFQAGRTAYREGRYDDAVDRFLYCARVRPDEPLLTSWLATSLLAVGRSQEAATLLQDLVQKTPADAVAHANLGLAYELMGMLDPCVVQYEEALRLDPELRDATYNLSTAYMALGRPGEAERLWRERLAAHPDDRQATLNLALVLEGMKRYMDAEQLLAPPEGQPVDNGYAPHLARLMVLAGQADAGLAAMATLEGRGSLSPRAREDFAVALVEAGRVPEALQRFEDPALRGVLSARGLTAYAEGLGRSERWLDMYAVLSEVVRNADFQQRWKPADRAAVYARVSWLAERAGDKTAAEANARSALALDPAQPTAQAVLQRLGKGPDPFAELESAMTGGGPSLTTVQDYVRQACARPDYKPPAAALDVLERVGSEDADLLNRIAVLFLRVGRAESAMQRLSKVVAADDSSAIAHNNLGVAYELLGRTDEAAREYEAAARLDPTSEQARSNLERLTGRGHG